MEIEYAAEENANFSRKATLKIGNWDMTIASR